MTSPRAWLGTQNFGGYRLLVGIALTMGVVMVLVVLFSHRGLYQIYRFRHERLRLDQENARLAAENLRLARTIDRLHNDPIFIQDLIRQELNFVKKNDIIFQFPPEKPGPMAEQYPPNAGEGLPPGRAQGVSARKVGKAFRVCPPQAGPAKKATGIRIE